MNFAITGLVRRALHALDATLSIISAIVLFALMIITVVDVIGRYVLNRPLPGAAEISATLLAVLVFLSLPQINYRLQNIRVDLFDLRNYPFIALLSRLLTRLATSLCSAWLAFELTLLAGDFARKHDMSSYLHIPWAPLAYLMATMALIGSLYAAIGKSSIDTYDI